MAKCLTMTLSNSLSAEYAFLIQNYFTLFHQMECVHVAILLYRNIKLYFQSLFSAECSKMLCMTGFFFRFLFQGSVNVLYKQGIIDYCLYFPLLLE